MKRMKKMLACLLSVGLLAGMVTGCGSSRNSQDSQDSQASSAAPTETTPTATDSTVEESGETIKVGLLFSFGGSEATLEKCMYNGALLAVEQVNEAGGINGKKIEEHFLDKGTNTEDFSLTTLGYEKIPKDMYVVLGDNRENSLDSREIGLIKRKDILGKIKLRIWPINKFGPVK